MANTGKKAYNTLVQVYVDTGEPTGETKSNDPEDPDYIAPVDDPESCPPPVTPDPDENKIAIWIHNNTRASIGLQNVFAIASQINAQPYWDVARLGILPNSSDRVIAPQLAGFTDLSFKFATITNPRLKIRMTVQYLLPGTSTWNVFDVRTVAIGQNIAELVIPTPLGTGGQFQNILRVDFDSIGTVDPTPPPVVNAGVDKTITLPTNTTDTTGSATTAVIGVTIVSTVWSQVSGPSTAIISSPTTVATNFESLIEGVYVFRLTATDSLGVSSTDDITVTVNPQVNNDGDINVWVDTEMPDTSVYIDEIKLVNRQTGVTSTLTSVNIDKTSGVKIFHFAKGNYDVRIKTVGTVDNERSLSVMCEGGAYRKVVNLPAAGEYTFENFLLDEGDLGLLISLLSTPTTDPSFQVVFVSKTETSPVVVSQNLLPNRLLVKQVGAVKAHVWSDASGTTPMIGFLGIIKLKYTITDNLTSTSSTSNLWVNVPSGESEVLLYDIQSYQLYDYDLTPNELVQQFTNTSQLTYGEGYLAI